MRYSGAVQFQGVLAPLCTPFDEAGELCPEALRANLRRYREAGLAGYVAAGSTGEAPLLSREERLRVFETVRDAADGGTLIAGAGVESVRETNALVADAAEMGYHAALVLTPHYYRAQMARPATQDGFFRAVADAARIPILIYNFPQMTGIDLPLEVAARLAEHPNIGGIKESSADLERIAALIRSVPPGFPVLVGASGKFHDALRLGAAGGILAIANALPRAARLVYDRFRAGDLAGSEEAQRRIVEAAGVAPRYGIQGLKHAMDILGLYGGPARLPLLPLDSRQKAEIEALFAPLAGP